jgi:hypothetical protein
MSHIDEGALHAYLDGALEAYPAAEAARIREHLDACEACAARLEEERAVRGEAETILASSAPVVQMPPLEELRTLAEQRTAAASSRGLSRVNRWGWAASVVLALGTGWMLRGTIPTVISPPAVQEDAAEPSVATPAPDAQAVETQTRQAGEQAEGPTRGAGEVVEGAAAPVVQEVVDVPVTPGGAAEREDAAADEDVGVDAAAKLVQPDPAEARTMPAAPPPATSPSAAVAVTAEEAAPRREQRVLVDSAGRDAARFRAERSAPENPEEPRAGEALTLRSRTATEAGPPQIWRVERDPAVLEDVTLMAGAPAAFLVPGLEVIDVAYLEDVEIPGVIRVRQRTEQGDTLEIVHFPEGYDPTNLPDFPDDGRTELSVASGPGWIMLRGRGDREDLGLYLQRMTGR